MRHVYRCPIRWADMDLQAHVNNVAYVDYLQEARIDMLAGHARFGGAAAGQGTLTDGIVVVRHEVSFLAPLVYRPEPVTIDVWVAKVRAASIEVAYEMYDAEPDGGRRRYLQALTVLAPFDFAADQLRRLRPDERERMQRFADDAVSRTAKLGPIGAGFEGHLSDLWVRFSDVDAYGHVNNVKYVEYFQEARVLFLRELAQSSGGQWRQWVVAHTDIDYLVPITFRAEPYAVRSWVEQVGTSSVTIRADIEDPLTGQVLSRGRAVLVGFDQATQAAQPLTPEQRQRLIENVQTGR